MDKPEKILVWSIAWALAIWLAYQNADSIWSWPIFVPLALLTGLGLWQKYRPK